jgi:hypothetical protein
VARYFSGQDTLQGGAAAVAVAPPAVAAPSLPTSKLRCARCLNTLEVASDELRSHVRCTRCKRRLKLPRVVRVPCDSCGCHGEYSVADSGRRVPCASCNVRIQIPIQLVRPGQRRRSRRQSSGERGMGGLAVSIGLTLLAALVCWRLLATM